MATLLVAEHDNKTLKDSTNKALTAGESAGADVDVWSPARTARREPTPPPTRWREESLVARLHWLMSISSRSRLPR
jgi:hypothetical protein